MSALVQLYRARAQNNLDQAQAWKTLLDQMQSRVLESQKEVDKLEQEVAERDGYIRKVTDILQSNGLETPTYVFRRRPKPK